MSIMRRGAMAGMAAVLTLSSNAVSAAELLGLDLSRHPFTGDFDGIMARGFVRILAPYSRTLLFQDKGSFHGVAAEAAEELENYIRRTYPALKQKFVVVLIPTSRDRLLPDLLAGLGDIAAGDITITPDRQKVVSFTTPTYSGIKELVVTAAGAPPLSSAEDLSGKEIAARPTTSTYASLVALNERLAGAGRPKATIIELPPVLEVEDMMEMVAAGLLLPAIPAEDWVADLWLPLVPGLQVHHNAVLRSGAEVGWAVRPASPELLKVLNTFLAQLAASPQSRHDFVTYYNKQTRRMYAATNQEEMRKFNATIAFFEKYGPQYGFDGLMLVAQGYQESLLDQSTRSPAGAIGLMQLLPSTGREMGVGNIAQAEANVHAGAKYMRTLLDVYLKDADFDEQNRALFAFACYNAGPGQIAGLRREAKAAGLNENVWFDNVERIAARGSVRKPSVMSAISTSITSAISWRSRTSSGRRPARRR